MTEGTVEKRVIQFTTLDDFLDEEGIREEVTERAIRRVSNLQLLDPKSATSPTS